jgi:outer membrane protein
MNKSILILVVASILLSSLALYKSMRQTKVAYIRSSELIYAYEGMKESQRVFQSKKATDQSNLDTLRLELEQAFNTYSKEVVTLNDKDKKERLNLLQMQEQNYLRYAESIKEKEKKEEQSMTEGVLNQVNSFVEQFSKDHGYDVVLGTTNSGSLLYANEGMDITKEVLEALNTNYKSQPADTKK